MKSKVSVILVDRNALITKSQLRAHLSLLDDLWHRDPVRRVMSLLFFEMLADAAQFIRDAHIAR